MKAAERAALPALAVAAALALGPAVSLGLARFAYALLLPPMRADLGWSYFTSGAMNTANSAGYLVGALLTPALLRRHGARAVLIAGTVSTALLLIAHGGVASDAALYGLRLATGIGSALSLIAGAVLAARVASWPAAPGRRAPGSGLMLGLYYGGAGLGIAVSAWIVPPLAGGTGLHPWQPAWAGLGGLALACGAVLAIATQGRAAAFGADPWPPGSQARLRWRPLAPALAAYLLFGLGYIGYMTFVVTLLHEQQLAPDLITAFFALLGLAVVASSWLWAGMLQRFRGGESLAALNALLAVATLLPVLSRHPLAVFGSGLLFGGVFASVVTSTTALVRHNLAMPLWPAGIAAFTTMFATGQIVGPAFTGLVSDRYGGLRAGLACSAAVLAAAAFVASRQRPLGQGPADPVPGA